MKVKGGNFLLEHIEKVALFLAGVFFLVLLFTRVIVSPNHVKYNGKEYSPGAIDEVIDRKAQEVLFRLNSSPERKGPPESKCEELIVKFKSPVDVDTSLYPPLPGNTSGKPDLGERYAIPSAPEISDAQVEHIRAVAYIPIEEIDSDTSYQDVETEPNDLDIVTVEAKVDVRKLYETFTENFAGSAVKPEWQNPELAEPVFAAVHLQRSELSADGQWSDWKNVPRIRTDNMSELLKIIENVSDLPRGGLEVRLLQYKNTAVKLDVLQPLAYDIASAEDDWLPPTLHRELVRRLNQQKMAERREEMEERREEREAEIERARSRRMENRPRESSRSGRTTTRGVGGGDLLSRMGGSGPGAAGGVGGERSSGTDRSQLYERRRREREERRREMELSRGTRQEDKTSINAVYEQFRQSLINEDTELAGMTEPLSFWAHDDTVEAGKTYRYRIRLGVFNPVAGTKKIKSDYESYKEQVVIWSNVLETEKVEIPKKLYFFAKDIQQAANTVKVEIFRYTLGYWYPRQYAVEAGEAIGKIDEIKKEETDNSVSSNVGEESLLVPEKVDFRTGAIMVDTAEVEDWYGINVLLPRRYFNFYYSYDGTGIEEMPVQQGFWASKTRDLYRDLSSLSEQERKPFRQRGQGMVDGYGPQYTPQRDTREPVLELMRLGPALD